MSKNYFSVQISIIEFTEEDVIRTSDGLVYDRVWCEGATQFEEGGILP